MADVFIASQHGGQRASRLLRKGQDMTSKRRAYRFAGNDHLVSYKTAYDAGEGRLRNISAAGCAFCQASLPLSVAEKILVTIELAGADRIFQAQGVVSRVESEGCTAIRFTLVEPEDQMLVRNYFAQLLRRK